ncbi:hypothetical protein ALMP_18550 [Streptomyces sp. A012304]|nr:hypothetical protein ALMP_18550 [Streptomyces sp. A012304]
MSLRIAYHLFPQTPGQEIDDLTRWIEMARPEDGDAWLRLNGAGENLTWAAADFENFTQPRPELNAYEAEFEKAVRLLMENGWGFRLHATYDETIRRDLAVFEKLAAEGLFPAGNRWLFDHAETVSPASLDRVAALGGALSVQNRLSFQGEAFLRRYGTGAAADAPPLAAMLERGLTVAAGTDATRLPQQPPSLRACGKAGLQQAPQGPHVPADHVERAARRVRPPQRVDDLRDGDRPTRSDQQQRQEGTLLRPSGSSSVRPRHTRTGPRTANRTDSSGTSSPSGISPRRSTLRHCVRHPESRTDGFPESSRPWSVRLRASASAWWMPSGSQPQWAPWTTYSATSRSLVLVCWEMSFRTLQPCSGRRWPTVMTTPMAWSMTAWEATACRSCRTSASKAPIRSWRSSSAAMPTRLSAELIRVS